MVHPRKIIKKRKVFTSTSISNVHGLSALPHLKSSLVSNTDFTLLIPALMTFASFFFIFPICSILGSRASAEYIPSEFRHIPPQRGFCLADFYLANIHASLL
jgi:hypothetical protein